MALNYVVYFYNTNYEPAHYPCNYFGPRIEDNL